MNREEKDEEFEIREYSKLELAILYSPGMRTESALKKLNRWVRYNAPLTRKLEEIGEKWHRRSYLPGEVKWIVYYLGTPG